MERLTKKATILIVDDVTENLHMLMGTLGDGYLYIPAKDGPSALRKAEKAPQLDLILLDILMPDMDGYEVLSRLKQHPDLKKVPVIFITAVTEARDGAKGFRLGAVDYITKPFIPEVARSRVATHVELKQKTDLLEKLAHTDGLTGIFNRRGIDRFLDGEFRRAMRSGSPLSVAMIDIDHFKLYNDHYGHFLGDECLKTVTGAIGATLKRPSDAVGRFGGEEFLVVLGGTDETGARGLGARFLSGINRLGIEHPTSPTATHVTVSVGCATTRPGKGGLTEKNLVDAADRMLYAAKTGGRNTVRTTLVRPNGVQIETPTQNEC